MAVYNNDISKIEKYIKCGGDINPNDNSDISLLALASGYGDIEIISYLINAGADLEAGNSSALFHAARRERMEVVKLLLEKGANPNSRTKSYQTTPLMAAASYGNTEICKLLISYKADPRLQNKAGKSAIDNARDNGFSDLALFLSSVHENGEEKGSDPIDVSDSR